MLSMKNIYYILMVSALALFYSCQEPEYVEPTADRQGITSLTAYFTSGTYVDQELARLDIVDPDAERYVIPVPWFFPEETEDATTFAMTRVRVRAELANNCSINPPLTIMDLTQENHFTYTNAQGESRPIVITGKRTKSAKCNLMSFALTKPYRVDGFVNDETNEIYLFTVDDLNGFSAEAKPCAHASVETDLAVKKNYNNDQEVTVIAQDGITERTYTIQKRYPSKIPYGIRDSSARELFNFDPVSRLGFPAPVIGSVNAYPSLGYIDGSLVVCLGDGSVPVYLDGLTGVRKGEINLGSATAASVTSDEGGNLLITNHAESKGLVEIYRTRSVSEAPVLFHSFENATDVPVGYHVKVHGNIDSDAVIILTHEGIAGITSTSKYTRILVSGGQITATETIDLSGLSLGWGEAPAKAAKVVSASATPNNGVILSYYTPYTGDTHNTMYYVNGNGSIAASLDMINNENIKINTNLNSNVLDCKTYNNATYTVSFITSHFPEWTVEPRLYVFDTTSPTSIKEGVAVMKNDGIEMYQTGFSATAAGDVIMAPSADGFKAYIYYFDHNGGVIGGYVADCISFK